MTSRLIEAPRDCGRRRAIMRESLCCSLTGCTYPPMKIYGADFIECPSPDEFPEGCPLRDAPKVEARESVWWFAEQMEKQLQANDHKGGWEDELPEDLLQRLSEEFGELAEALGNRNPLRITREAADVANFAMMISDLYRDRPSVEEVEEKEV